jgi:hypothetical protein
MITRDDMKPAVDDLPDDGLIVPPGNPCFE